MKENLNVTFKWNTQISSHSQLPEASAYVWAAGTTHSTPEIYEKHGRVQGIGGFWFTLPNRGCNIPFKISAPQPSGYINFTPDGDRLHVSGGFGWTGERGFQESCELLEPTKARLIEHVSLFLDIPVNDLNKQDFGCCIRPTTPTGLPDVKLISHAGSKHIMISGSGKAGGTQSPLLALHVARCLKLDTNLLEEYGKDAPESKKQF